MTDEGEIVASRRAGAKVILLGEHFVVSGSPALAIPLSSVGTTARVRDLDDGAPTRLRSDFDGDDRGLARRLLDTAQARLGIVGPRGWHVDVSSTIPVGCGLGSSAALAVALVGALAEAEGLELSPREINDHAHALEQVVHGQPSGIDDAVVTFGRPLRFCAGEAPQQFPLQPGLRFVLGSDGERGSTRDAVAGVQRRRAEAPAWFADLAEQARSLVDDGVAAYRAGNRETLGTCMDCNQTLLREVGVSTASLDRLIDVARTAGASGAKLTGAGLGGFVVALVDARTEEAVARAFEDAGARDVLRAV